MIPRRGYEAGQPASRLGPGQKRRAHGYNGILWGDAGARASVGVAGSRNAFVGGLFLIAVNIATVRLARAANESAQHLKRRIAGGSISLTATVTTEIGVSFFQTACFERGGR